jgi:ABC-type sugar transport system ATPase subunit
MTNVSAATGIAARDVCKSFGDHLVLDEVSLAAEEGRILALLGPNGAGKTTMVRILSTLISADSGTMRVANHDVASDPDGVRAVIGVTGQFSAVDNLLTGAENLRLMADLRHLGREAGQRRVTYLLEQFSERRPLPTRTSSSSKSPQTAAWTRSATCWTSCTRPASTSNGCRSTPRISTTCSSPSPAATSASSATRTQHHKE